MTCRDCDLARSGLWHGYAAACFGCQTRAIARGVAAFEALGTMARPEVLQSALRIAFSPERYEAARRAVWDWWQMDHKEPA